MDTLIAKMAKNMDTVSIDFTLKDSTVALASQFWWVITVFGGQTLTTIEPTREQTDEHANANKQTRCVRCKGKRTISRTNLRVQKS